MRGSLDKQFSPLPFPLAGGQLHRCLSLHGRQKAFGLAHDAMLVPREIGGLRQERPRYRKDPGCGIAGNFNPFVTDLNDLSRLFIIGATAEPSHRGDGHQYQAKSQGWNSFSAPHGLGPTRAIGDLASPHLLVSEDKSRGFAVRACFDGACPWVEVVNSRQAVAVVQLATDPAKSNHASRGNHRDTSRQPAPHRSRPARVVRSPQVPWHRVGGRSVLSMPALEGR